MIRLVALYGVGDAYLVCSLVRAFEKHHGMRACVVVKCAQVAIPQMFGIDFEVDDTRVHRAEGHRQYQLDYENVIEDDGVFYVHPHFVRSPVRVDQLTVKPRVSQCDMYRALLGLSPWAELEVPRVPLARIENGVLIIPKAKSWPNLPSDFWDILEKHFAVRCGFTVLTVRPDWTLSQILDRSARSLHVIGPQCGVMSVLIEAGFPCRKTLAITELSAANPYLFGLTETMPYGHCSTFAGNDHPDVRHFVVSPTNWEEAVERIAAGI